MEESTEHINVAEAKRRFSDLLGRVAYGKEVITITRRGRPMARLVPIDPPLHAPHLADVEGWVEDDDVFLAFVDTLSERRSRHVPRVWRDGEDVDRADEP